ncbi:MAG: HEAT repeat domain-containing protein [Halobacteriota archaeon]
MAKKEKNDKSKPNIEELKAKKDVKGLIRAMGHEDEDIRMYASLALANMDESVIDPLINTLKKSKNENLIWGAIWVLSKMGKPAVEPLKKLQEHKSERVRMNAQMVLDMIYEEGKIFFE